ncbi:MAG TPA: chemotaxis-specific protein-glutamate methyltransferase CheB [Xenococcaceae cyanobacterium]|jgi:two-component system chemotaxis response regulator CheB
MPIRVLIVEDSAIFQTVLKNIFQTSPDIEVVGTASNGVEGLALIPQLNPDVICTDFHMPKMDGLEFTKQVMATDPRPILVISVSVQTEQRHRIFELLEAGAVDIFPKPRSGESPASQIDRLKLVNKIKVLAGVRVFKKRASLSDFSSQPLSKTPQQAAVNFAAISQPRSKSPQQAAATSASGIKIVAIGTSTGGPQALQAIFEGIPANFPVPIVCVQHISHGFLDGLIQWLALSCPLPIQIASSGMIPQSGTIYFPPEKKHLELDSQGRFICSDSSPVGGHLPAVDVTFKSIAKVYGSQAIAILLTGMGKDGAAGMRLIQQAGGLTIAQNQETSVIFGMPKEAIELGAVKHILSLPEITPFLLGKVMGV